ncbi:unnamed protein product [Ectocarpus sp. 12 AP-2014]
MPPRMRSVSCLQAVVSPCSSGRPAGRWSRQSLLIAPHRPSAAPARRLTTTAGAAGAPPRGYSRHRHPRNPVPGKDDLPTILTAAGMVKLCGLPRNRGSPLVGLDVAPSNFGVAVSDETRTLAFPLTRVPRRLSTRKLDPALVIGKLREIVEDSSACGLVVGWPLSKSGRAEGQCLMVLQFLRQLHLRGKVDIPVTLFDERMTSVEARGILKDDGLGKCRKIAEREDETAAMVILQGFLDSAEAVHGGLSTLPTGSGRGDR